MEQELVRCGGSKMFRAAKEKINAVKGFADTLTTDLF